MVSRKLRVPALFLAASVALLGAGCVNGVNGVNGNSISGVVTLAKAGNLEKTTLKVGVLANLDSAGFFVALHEGLFRTQGLNVKFVPAISSETVIAGQMHGQYDITAGNYVSYIQAQFSHRADLRGVDGAEQLSARRRPGPAAAGRGRHGGVRPSQAAFQHRATAELSDSDATTQRYESGRSTNVAAQSQCMSCVRGESTLA